MFAGEINILGWLEQCRTPFLNSLMEAITMLGEETLLIVLISVIYFMFHKENAYRLCFLTVASLGLNGIIKNLFTIPRPFATGKITCVRPETATGYSFPSGHTQNFATWSTALSQMLKKRWLTLVAILLSVAVGFSRLYLGVHYPSDVLVGLFFGIGIGIFGSLLYQSLKNPRKLYFPTFVVMMLFGICFLIKADPHFADYFKCVGLMGGLSVSSVLDSRFASLDYGVPFYKKLLRVIVAIILALVIKKALGAIPVPTDLSIILIWDTLRYLMLSTIVFGIYPLCLSKFK